MVDLTERWLLLFLIFIVYISQHSQSESTGDKKQLEELEEANEERREKELAKIYSTSKANAFLTYDKCLQRMKCPVNRKEECSEECKAGNTEEEIEEHEELTRVEHRNSFNKSPKQKYEANIDSKKRSSKSKHSSSSSNKQSNPKTDL